MGIDSELLKNLFRKPSTKSYPYQKIKPFPRFRGKITFDKSKCIGCGLCRAYCPAECIKLSWKKSKIIVKGVEHQKLIHPIQEINICKCITCGQCVDVCPIKCMWFTQEYELANKDKEKLVSQTV